MTDQGFVHLSDNGAWRDLAGRFRAATPQIKAFLSQSVRDITEQVAAAVQAEAPSRTGVLRQSVRSVYGQNDGDTVAARVVVGAPYAVMVWKGTRSHVIEPRTARALRFVVNGRVVYARQVRHPGGKANPFIERALGRFGLTAKAVQLSDRVIALLRVAS